MINLSELESCKTDVFVTVVFEVGASAHRLVKTCPLTFEYLKSFHTKRIRSII